MQTTALVDLDQLTDTLCIMKRVQLTLGLEPHRAREGRDEEDTHTHPLTWMYGVQDGSIQLDYVIYY